MEDITHTAFKTSTNAEIILNYLLLFETIDMIVTVCEWMRMDSCKAKIYSLSAY